MRSITLLLVVAMVAGQAHCDGPERIVGGDIVQMRDFKYMASLQFSGVHECGGAIISSTHILTAAHCVWDKERTPRLTVVTGTNDLLESGQRHHVECIRIHPKYKDDKETGWKHDIAVITLTKPIKMNDFQAPIPLASKDLVHGGKRGIATGWGKMGRNRIPSDVLRSVSVKLVTLEECLEGHKKPRTHENHICTQERIGKGVCQGDSGGPLVVDGELVGVVSWLIPCALGISDVWTNVYKYLDFIKEAQRHC